MSERVDIGLIGCGGMMGAHVKGYGALWEKDLKDIRIVAACDVERGRAEAMADKVAEFQGTRPRVYACHEEMLNREDSMTAVDISVVHRDHHTVAIPCLEAQKHVTIEKPLGYTMRAAMEMMKAARRNNRLLQTAENYRYIPSNRAQRWAIENGRVGELRMMFCHQIFERLWYWGWRDEKDLAGGGWTMDGGVHTADLMLYLLGLDARRAYGVVKKYTGLRYRDRETMAEQVPATIEDSTWCTIEFDKNVVASWLVTIAAPGEGARLMTVYGEDGSISGAGLTTRQGKVSMQDLVAEYRKSLSEEQSEWLFPRGIEDTCAIELYQFGQAILNGRPLETDDVAGYKALALCFALYESSWMGEPVEIPDIEALRIENYQVSLNIAAGLGA